MKPASQPKVSDVMSVRTFLSGVADVYEARVPWYRDRRVRLQLERDLRVARDDAREAREIIYSLREPLWNIETMMATDSRDWASNACDAWLYGLLVGWSDGDGVMDEGAVREFVERFSWSPSSVDVMRVWSEAIAAVRS